MTKNRIISREGQPYVLALLFITMASGYFLGEVWMLPGFLMAMVCIVLYRDPDRVIPSKPLGIISPVDGKLINIGEVFDPYLNRRAISFNMSINWLGVYVVRSPIEGKVVEQWHQMKPREQMASGLCHGSSNGSYHTLHIRTDEGEDVLLSIASGPFGWAPKFLVQPGERIGQGERCAFSKLSRRVEVLVPMKSNHVLEQGLKVSSGRDVLTELVHRVKTSQPVTRFAWEK